MYAGNYCDEQYRCIIDQDTLDSVKEVFNRLDTHGDLMVGRAEILKELRKDPMTYRLWERPVFYIAILEQEIKLGQIIRYMQDELVDALRIDPRGQEYITWGELESHFRILRKKLVLKLNQDLDKEITLEVPSEYISVMKDVFDMVPRIIEGYVHKDDFFGEAMKDVQIQAFLEEPAFPADKNAPPGQSRVETFRQALYRLTAEMKKYICWLDVVQFFSAKNYSNANPATLKETQWKYIADNILMDEKGLLNRESRGIDQGLANLNRVSHHNSLGFQESKFGGNPKSSHDGLYGERLEATITLDTQSQTSKTGKGSSRTKSKPVKMSAAQKYAETLEKDLYVSEAELREHKLALMNKAFKKEITVPKGPKCAEPRPKGPSIMEKKTKEYFDKKEQEELEELKKQFKAKEVPMSVVVPKFGTIVQAQKERSQQNRAISRERTLQAQKPFSFYEKDKEKFENRPSEPPLLGEDFKFGFKANNLPTFYAQADVDWDVLTTEQEQKRAKQKEEHKKKLIEESKLPSRMEDDIKKKPEKEKQLEKLKQELEKDNTFKPKIKKEVPNFKELQENFTQELDKKKNSFMATKPEGFSFLAPKAIPEAPPKAEEGNEEEAIQEEAPKEKPTGPKKPPAAEAINTFLMRNYATTEQSQLEAKKALVEKNSKKIENLKKQTENAKADSESLARKVVAPKELMDVVTDKRKAGDVIKAKYDPRMFDSMKAPDAGELGQEGEEIDIELGLGDGQATGDQGELFAMEAVEAGDQALPGMAPQPRTVMPAARVAKPKVVKPEPPKLFSNQKKPEEKKLVDPNRKTKVQLETEKMKGDKQKEANKLEEEEKKASQLRKEKQKKAAERVRFKMAEEGLLPVGDQAVPGQPNPVQEEFNRKTKEFDEKRAEMDKRVDKKACLVEEKSHASKVLQEYRRLMKERGVASAKTSQVVSVASKEHVAEPERPENVDVSLEEVPEVDGET